MREDKQWFVMKAANNKATSAKKELKARNIESFVPLKRTIRKNRSGVEIIATVPLLPSWIFVNSDYPTIQEINRTIDYLYPIYDRTIGTREIGVAMTIPQEEMEEFIAFTLGNEDNIDFIDTHSEIDLKRGEKVRITSGPFAGRTATFIKIKGRRSKQIVVKIEGFAAVTTSAPFTVEKVKNI